MIELKIEDYISENEKINMWKRTKELSGSMFDRQKDQKYSKNRRIKIYIGLISEYIFQKYIEEHFNNIKLFNNGLSNNGIDEYDFKLNDYILIDIKSSKEKKNNFYNDKIKFFERRRNYTLPFDQVKEKYLKKSNEYKYYIVQMMYDFDFKNVYISNFMNLNELVNQNNLRNLKLDNLNFQKTYMKKLFNGEDIETFLKDLNSSISKDIKKEPNKKNNYPKIY
jgi:hypothetical protein